MIEYEIKPAGKFSLNLKEIWNYRELFYFFTWRDIKVKYKQTFLGVIWAILQPLVMMLLFTLFFGKVLKVPSDNIPYPIFVYSGLILWNIFASGLANSGDSMVANANIIKKIYFPRLIIPISAILVSVFDFLITFTLFIGLLIYFEANVDLVKFLLYFPLAVFVTVLCTFGLGTFLSALNVKYRDFRYLIPFLIQSLFFITPVIYSTSIIDNRYIKWLMALNPMAGAIQLARAPFTGQNLDIELIIISIGSAICLFALGLFVFRKTEAYFADLA